MIHFIARNRSGYFSCFLVEYKESQYRKKSKIVLALENNIFLFPPPPQDVINSDNFAIAFIAFIYDMIYKVQR